MGVGSLVALAFVAGAAASLNPCGFALLPAYLGYFLSRGSGSAGGIRAGLRAGTGMAAGTLTVFGGLGAVLSAAGYSLVRFVPLGAVAVGVAVALAGALMLARPSVTVGLSLGSRLLGRTPDRGWPAFFVFGAGYGVASLGCASPLFLAVTAQAFAAGGLLGAVAVFAAYGLGMGSVLLGFSALVGAGHGGLVEWARGWTSHVRTAGAVGMVVAGAYLVYVQVRLGALAAVRP